MKMTSTPMKHGMTADLPLPSASSISSGSHSEHADDFAMAGIGDLERGPIDEASIQQLDASMTSLDLNASAIDYEAFNDIRNATIDWLDEPMPFEAQETDGDSDSDGDYVPPICVRSGGALANKIDLRQYEEIAMEDTVHDVSGIDLEEEEEEEEGSAKLPDQRGLEFIGEPASIAYHHCLKELAESLILPISKCKTRDKYSSVECQSPGPFRVTVKSRATAAIIEWICPFGHVVWRWRSQPTLKYGLQIGDFMLATNILLSGNNYGKVALLFKFMNIGMVGKNTFFKIQDTYCVDTIEDFWEEKRKVIISRLQNKPDLVVLGDGRMDSPGFSAAYCTYTVMENDSKEIIYMHTEEKRKRGRNSVIMEKEAFIISLDSLLNDLKNLKEVCTDAHPQISVLFKKGKYKDSGVRHTLDMWHGSKNLGKKIHQVIKITLLLYF
uniref:Uncharacterized protein n=1 Tax=Neogobius melanostomus TaxID=47308 RepID=A0A8C6UAK9_9GOBI